MPIAPRVNYCFVVLYSENTAESGQFSNNVIKWRKVTGGVQAGQTERRKYDDIKLSSSWHPDLLRNISVDTLGPARPPELSDLWSHYGPAMPGVFLPPLFHCIILGESK